MYSSNVWNVTIIWKSVVIFCCRCWEANIFLSKRSDPNHHETEHFWSYTKNRKALSCKSKLLSSFKFIFFSFQELRGFEWNVNQLFINPRFSMRKSERTREIKDQDHNMYGVRDWDLDSGCPAPGQELLTMHFIPTAVFCDWLCCFSA